MGSSQKNLIFLLILLLSFPICGMAQEANQTGRMLFLIQQGEHQKALKLYQSFYEKTGKHDFALLHEMGLKILDYGFHLRDPECQLLALFGASVAAHEDAYYILEEGLKNALPQIQLVALETIAQFQTDKGDQALLHALGSPFLEVRFEAARHLCKKKHQQAVHQAESLMYKMPGALRVLFPPLFAAVGDAHCMQLLNKLLTHSSKSVRLEVILSLAKQRRDDFLPQILKQSTYHQFALQEACAYAMEVFKDAKALSRLKELAQSHSPIVELAANRALFHLGDQTTLKKIVKRVQAENVFAISILSSLTDRSDELRQLLESENRQVYFNALIALIMQGDPWGIKKAHEIILRDKRDLAFIPLESPGKTIQSWKVVTSASQLLKDYPDLYHKHLDLKISILNKIKECSPTQFIALAHDIFTHQQNALIPITVELLEEMDTSEAIECLKTHQQQLGAPLVRQYCNLGLYRLNEKGCYGEQLRKWINAQNKSEFIHFEAFKPWTYQETPYQLTPLENSKLLIEVFETFAKHQDPEGINTLIEAMATGHEKNKYALAGLLVRATQ